MVKKALMGPSPSTISRTEWLAALNDADTYNYDPAALTVSELVTLWGMSENTVRRRVKQLMAKGKVTMCRKRLLNASGQEQPVLAYKLKP